MRIFVVDVVATVATKGQRDRKHFAMETEMRQQQENKRSHALISGTHKHRDQMAVTSADRNAYLYWFAAQEIREPFFF